MKKATLVLVFLVFATVLVHSRFEQGSNTASTSPSATIVEKIEYLPAPKFASPSEDEGRLELYEALMGRKFSK